MNLHQPILARVFISGCLFMGACSAPPAPLASIDVGQPPAVAASPARDAFTLGPSDLLHVNVYGHAQASTPISGVRVAPDGTLSLPLAGVVKVEGLSVGEAASLIEDRLGSSLRNPSVSVSVLEYQSRRFYLFGEIKNTGAYPMDRPLSALEALSLGGGLLPGANDVRAFVIRKHGESDINVIPFNAQTLGPDGLIQVLPGDMLFVQKSGVGVFRESTLPYLQGVGFTLSQIASLALAYDRLYQD